MNYYEELKQFLTSRNSKDGLEKLDKIKDKPVDVVKMYNAFGKVIKDFSALQQNNARVGLKEQKTFKIKSEDKAAFINRLEKVGIPIGNYQIHDDKLDGFFSIEFTDPESINMINRILKDSPKIDVVKENVYTDEKSSTDTITMNIPLFIRMLEYAKEDAKDDIDLHKVTEYFLNKNTGNPTFTMKDYPKFLSEININKFNPSIYEWEKD
jgi:hypothetical protein